MFFQEVLLSLGMEDRMFTNIANFVEHSHELNEETYAQEFSKFSAIDRQNIQATEYIAYWAYPTGRFKKDMLKSMIVAFGQTYYPIAGWNPDAAVADEEGVKESVIRKQLKRMKKRVMHNPQENRTYILYG